MRYIVEKILSENKDTEDSGVGGFNEKVPSKQRNGVRGTHRPSLAMKVAKSRNKVALWELDAKRGYL